MSCGVSETETDSQLDEIPWQSLFDGETLNGWNAKLAGEPFGQDSLKTFIVQDSMIQVRYDRYDSFENRFGHLFYETPFKNYILSLEYRFVGEQIGNMEWAHMNSGVMYHCQDPSTMELDQGFPISLEGQFLGAKPGQIRPTGNLCTPGMHVVMNDALTTEHCITAKAPSIPKYEWVTAVFVVNGHQTSHHIINGDTVISFSNPIIGGEFWNESYGNKGEKVESGYIALQSESHPIDFRNIKIKVLP